MKKKKIKKENMKKIDIAIYQKKKKIKKDNMQKLDIAICQKKKKIKKREYARNRYYTMIKVC